jgi:nitroimidazol reductase NimA-like FMN-containing flavoprotein (pyridoxamine 5'-phosphate oxidase superfamily)
MDTYGVAMTDDEVGSFLARQGHGVLSFGGEVPYGLPVSFGYDEANDRCVFQLLFAEDSKKASYLAGPTRVTLVSYEWDGVDEWRSVIVDGELSPIEAETAAAIDAADVFAEHATVVGLSVFDHPATELESEWYELAIVEKSGRKAPSIE